MENTSLFDTMRSAIVLHSVNGNLFFLGIAIFITTSFVKIALRKPLWSILQRIGSAFGVVFIVLSSTPLPYWFYFIWGIPVLVILFVGGHKSNLPLWRTYGISVLLIAFSLTAALLELPHHIGPRISIDSPKRAIVIGNSISAGIGTEKILWPTILQEKLNIEVVNVSEAGMKVNGAVKRAEVLEIAEPRDTIIILEIGGNDIIAKTEIPAFKEHFDTTLSLTSRCSNTVIVLELPLPPYCNMYGKVQRELVEKYDACMIPKRYFAEIIAQKDATIDGLHLSPTGHRMFAEMMCEILKESTEDDTDSANQPGI